MVKMQYFLFRPTARVKALPFYNNAWRETKSGVEAEVTWAIDHIYEAIWAQHFGEVQ